MDFTDAKEISSMSDNVVVLNQLKHIKSTFTKKFEELSANMEVMQSAVQYLSQNIVTINEKLETLQYSLSASLEYYQVVKAVVRILIFINMCVKSLYKVAGVLYKLYTFILLKQKILQTSKYIL